MNNKKRGAKAPRPDRTRNERQNKRMIPLDKLAREKGWTGISEYLTAIKNGQIEIQQKPASQ